MNKILFLFITLFLISISFTCYRVFLKNDEASVLERKDIVKTYNKESDGKKNVEENPVNTKYVIFDVNGSFWKPKTSDLLARYLKELKVSFFDKIKLGGYMIAHKMGTINFRSSFNAFFSYFKGMTHDEVNRICHSMWIEMCRDSIYKKAIEIFNDCKKNNVKTVIASSSLSELYDDLLKIYSFDYVCSSKAEFKDGKVTGKVIGKPCAGDDKVGIIKDLIENKLGGSLKNVTFYANSHRDISLLKKVGKPVAFNPDHKLDKYAKSKKWEIIKTDDVQKVVE